MFTGVAVFILFFSPVPVWFVALAMILDTVLLVAGVEHL